LEDLMSSMRVVAVCVFLMLAIACGGGYSSSASAPAPSPVPSTVPGGPSSSVSIPVGAALLGADAYAPDAVNVDAGTTVTWVNTDSVSHTSTSNAAGWNSGEVVAGGRFSVAFPTPGTFPYHCTIHPGMVGTVVVR
jgi:plastocyanin